jgi:hypothetical protein
MEIRRRLTTIHTHLFLGFIKTTEKLRLQVPLGRSGPMHALNLGYRMADHFI